jgi:hypothetical protein
VSALANHVNMCGNMNYNCRILDSFKTLTRLSLESTQCVQVSLAISQIYTFFNTFSR